MRKVARRRWRGEHVELGYVGRLHLGGLRGRRGERGRLGEDVAGGNRRRLVCEFVGGDGCGFQFCTCGQHTRSEHPVVQNVTHVLLPSAI